MQLTSVLLLGLSLQLSATGISQTISFSGKDVPLEQVFRVIKKQTGYFVSYKANQVRNASPVTITGENMPVEVFLHQALKDQPLDFSIEETTIFIKWKRDLPAPVPVQSLLSLLPPVDVTLRGVVTNNNNEPLEGVSVVVKGTQTGTTTNANGQFQLSVPSANNVELVFSFVGYETQTIKVAGQTVFGVVLKQAVSGLEDIVVVGYGTQKKVNLTGAVATVSKEVFENRTLSTPLAAMQGAVPGVGISRTSGKPGSENYQIQIRGFSSVNNVNVLVIIDGVRGSFSELNPNDIESVSVLKDAAAAAIYGSNAAGGVVLITTKKGRKEKVEVSYSGNYGITHASRMPTRMNSWDEAEYFDQAVINGTGTLYWGPTKQAWMQGKDLDVIDTYGIRSGVRPSDFPGEQYVIDPTRPNVWLSYGNFDQIAVALRKTNPIQSHNVSLRGGNDKTLYYFSAGYYDREGILRYADDSEERYNLRLNLQNKFTQKISLNTALSYTNNNVYAPVTSAETLI
ncbi:MAG: SusC/RagA family TonB-linked outer membrane protein, partial [Chitinophagaceae bacterium]|nr:SusC/RagA family TonB-linked outer membrane protein [Chitinophagaceae bacterium]